MSIWRVYETVIGCTHFCNLNKFKVRVKQKYIFVVSLSHHRNMCHWPLSQIWKIKKTAMYIKLGLKIMEKQALLSAVKRWVRVS